MYNILNSDSRMPSSSLISTNPLGFPGGQARVLEWIAISFSRGVFPTRGWNLGLHCRLILYRLSHQTMAPQTLALTSLYEFT